MLQADFSEGIELLDAQHRLLVVDLQYTDGIMPEAPGANERGLFPDDWTLLSMAAITERVPEHVVDSAGAPDESFRIAQMIEASRRVSGLLWLPPELRVGTTPVQHEVIRNTGSLYNGGLIEGEPREVKLTTAGISRVQKILAK